MWRFSLTRAGLVSLACCTLGTRALAQSPTTIFAPQATPAHSIFGLSMFVLSLTLGIFVVVTSLLVYVLVRFRQRREDADTEPSQIYGSNQIELSWTVIPGLLVVMLFLATARVIFITESAAKPSRALEITVIGHQFWWEYRYPTLGVVTANELHVPVSDPRHPTPAYLTMSSADVIHSFWVPRLAGKLDVIPNKVNVMWIDPEAPGLYLGQCAQYCGTQHAKMLLRVYAESPAEFSKWVSAQKQAAVEDAGVQAGRAVFMNNACMNCHAIKGTPANGIFGPDLTHVASRDTIGSGAIPNTPENLKAWIDNPDHAKPGSLMPAMHLNADDLSLVSAYLTTLH